MRLKIEVPGKGSAEAVLDERNPLTANMFYKNLPLDGNASLWYEEVYFQIPVNMEYENPSKTTVKGDISYWPPGSAFCIFFGESQPASEVNNIGTVVDNLELFFEFEENDKILIKRV